MHDVGVALHLHELGDLDSPGRATRPRSLRARSTSMRCSARSFGSASSSFSSRASSAAFAPRRLVPASGRMVAVPSRTFTCTSGEAPKSWKSPKSR